MAKLKYKSIIPNNKPKWLIKLQIVIDEKYHLNDYDGDMFDFDDLKKHIDRNLIELQKQGFIKRSTITTEIRCDEDKTVLFIRRTNKIIQTYYFEYIPKGTNMTLEQIAKQSQGERCVYPDIFHDNCGLDIVLPDDKLHAVRSWGYTKGNSKRRATLEVTTFRGISFNAIHYYGKIKIQGVNMECDGEPGHSRGVFDNNIPLAHYTYELELKRPLSKEEIEEDPDRWEDYYHEGDLTNCFETIEDVVALAKEVFRLRFTGEWEFYVESPYSRYDGVLDINTQQNNYE